MSWVYRKFLSDEEVDLVKEISQSVKTKSGSVADPMNRGGLENFRIVTEAPIHPLHDTLWLKQRIYSMASQHNQKGFRYQIATVNEINHLHYDPGGHYDWHQDVLWDSNMHRKFTVIIQLSDPDTYTGGDFLFRDAVLPLDGLREKGSALIFPSLLYHKITPVETGVRDSIVSWVVGDQWK